MDSRPSATNAKESPSKPATHLIKAKPRLTKMPISVDFMPRSAALLKGWSLRFMDRASRGGWRLGQWKIDGDWKVIG